LSSNSPTKKKDRVESEPIGEFDAHERGLQQGDADDVLINNQIKSYQVSGRAPKNDAFIKFSNKRREIVYSNMDDLSQHRFEDFMQSGFNEKKLKELLQELLGGKGKSYDGGKGKITDEIV